MAKKKKYDESEGVWRTIGGRRVFIRTGQSLSEAMRDSGKFGRREAKQKEQQEEELRSWRNFRDTSQKSLNRSSIPHSKEIYMRDRDMASKEIERIKKDMDYYDNPRISKRDLSDLEGKHIVREPKSEDWYYGKEAYEKFGNSIQDKFGGKEITKRIDKADTPTGLRTVAKEIGAKDEYDIVEALEGMARNGKAQEVSDGVFKIKNKEYDSVEDRYNKDKSFRDMLKNEHQKSLDTTRKEINSYFDMTLEDRKRLVGDENDLYKAINEDYGNIDRDEFDKIYKEELANRTAKDVAKSFGAKEVSIRGKKEKLDNGNIKDSNSALNKYISEKEAKDELKEISGGVVSTLQTTTPKSKADRLKPGTEIYYKGDQANTPGYFTIESYEPEKEQFMASLTLKEKGGEGRTKKIGAQQIEDSYTNNYASRFSFKEDYDNYRNKVFEGYAKQIEERKTKAKAELKKQAERRIWAEKTLYEEYAYTDKQGKKELEADFNRELRKQNELEKKYGKISEEDFKEMESNIYNRENYWDYENTGVKKQMSRFEASYLFNRYRKTYEYLEETTNMSGAEILELLKKIDKDKS